MLFLPHLNKVEKRYTTWPSVSVHISITASPGFSQDGGTGCPKNFVSTKIMQTGNFSVQISNVKNKFSHGRNNADDLFPYDWWFKMHIWEEIYEICVENIESGINTGKKSTLRVIGSSLAFCQGGGVKSDVKPEMLCKLPGTSQWMPW